MRHVDHNNMRFEGKNSSVYGEIQAVTRAVTQVVTVRITGAVLWKSAAHKVVFAPLSFVAARDGQHRTGPHRVMSEFWEEM